MHSKGEREARGGELLNWFDSRVLGLLLASEACFCLARSLPEGAEEWARGRLIGTNKMSIEILDTDGIYRYIARDVIVEVRLIAHMRPAYIDDEELLQFEREDHKRRTKIHEDVEKKTKGSDDDHLWG